MMGAPPGSFGYCPKHGNYGEGGRSVMMFYLVRAPSLMNFNPVLEGRYVPPVYLSTCRRGHAFVQSGLDLVAEGMDRPMVLLPAQRPRPRRKA